MSATTKTNNRTYTSVRDIGFSEELNPRYRRTMEDGHVIVDAFRDTAQEAYFAVYDGHGGREAVEYVQTHLHKRFATALSECPTVQAAFVRAYKGTDEELKSRQILYNGTTAVTCYIRTEQQETAAEEEEREAQGSGGEGAPSSSSEQPQQQNTTKSERPTVRKLYTANCGDARVVLNSDGRAQRLTYDHKASDQRETKRIQDNGGFVAYNRVNGILSVTRALGDHAMKDWVVCDPFYSEVVISDKERFLILACDGIWDVISDQEAVDLIKDESNAQTMSEILMKVALQRGSTDNISSMVIIL